MSFILEAAGYESLAQVLRRAFVQAAVGKGAERHANDLPFHEQPMQTIAQKRGLGFLLGQADKKSLEAQGMADRGERERAVHELLGAINYLAGAVIYIDALPEQTSVTNGQAEPEPKPEPDTDRPPAAHDDRAASIANDFPLLAALLDALADYEENSKAAD